MCVTGILIFLSIFIFTFDQFNPVMKKLNLKIESIIKSNVPASKNEVLMFHSKAVNIVGAMKDLQDAGISILRFETIIFAIFLLVIALLSIGVRGQDIEDKDK